MRGEFRDQGGLFSYVDPESRIPAGHPLRQIRVLVRAALKDLSRSFSRLYSPEGRPRKSSSAATRRFYFGWPAFTSRRAA
jgi:hypothetical protein